MASTRVDPAALNSSLRRLAEQSERNDLHLSLRRVIDYSDQLLSVDGGGVMLADDHGELHYVVANSESSHLLEQLQLDTGEGPCIDSFVRDEMTVTADVTHDDRYPELAQLIGPHGIHAVLAIPVHLSGFPIGTLNLHVNAPHEFDDSEIEALQRYGQVVQAMIHAAVTASQAGELADRLTYALDYRAPIERGIGFLMARDRLTHPDAFQKLRSAARSARRKVGDVATELLDTGLLPGEPAQHP